ncbi:hypothetical protein FB451DRAFT_1399621 [Mycena latifolia]|nr:hypothetical protein FB451DRAFT_1399621 [Mycena latifolia]
MFGPNLTPYDSVMCAATSTTCTQRSSILELHILQVVSAIVWVIFVASGRYGNMEESTKPKRVPTAIPQSAGYKHHGVEFWNFLDPSSARTTKACEASGEDPSCSDSVPSQGIDAAHNVAKSCKKWTIRFPYSYALRIRVCSDECEAVLHRYYDAEARRINNGYLTSGTIPGKRGLRQMGQTQRLHFRE